MPTNYHQNKPLKKVILFIRQHIIACQMLLISGLILLVRGYQRLISPLFGPKCRFTPTCSQYAIISLRRFGIVKGCWLTGKRVLKCHPLHEGGEDLVPPNTKK